MPTPISLRRAAGLVATLGAAGALLAGCGGSGSALSTVTNASATTPAASTNAAGSAMASMKGMTKKEMSAAYGSGKPVDGIKPIPTQSLATAEWQGMRIQAMAMTPVPFVIFNGRHERMVKPPKGTSFHLMVDLSDAHSHYPIPYAGVWATFRHNGKVIYDERQWPMLSEYIGPHYGNNVKLPGPGHYRLSLLISPPVSARHLEYKNVWTKPKRMSFSFDWKG